MDHAPGRSSLRRFWRALATMTAVSPVIVAVAVALATSAIIASMPRKTPPKAHLVSTQLSIGDAGISLHLIIR